ncbi:kielin/chordin-like protein isoform X2 [Megalobrama amblycephala]|uniref:kielin/chordin-like protein isoform X2 n=1 Tax=Megalobrama amblycephala TaxID=75352 RepID=UPI0020145ECA|nr:kielin/chordin-like protein isoform X2 [Megalobrama amblycephala]
MRLKSVVGYLVWSLIILWNVCDCVQTHQDANHPRGTETVINLLKVQNVTHSQRLVSKAKGRDPEMPAWRFRSRTPHLTLPQDLSDFFFSTSDGVLGLHLVGRQTKGSEATLISFISPAHLQHDGRPLLELVSNTQENWLQLEFRSANGQPEVIKLPGGNPFIAGGWVRMALSVEPRQVVMFLECDEAVVLKLKEGGRILALDFPHDLQVTFSSTAGNKASKFSGIWQTAELSTRAYERRPWICDNFTDSLPDTAQTTSPTVSAVSDLDMMQDQGDRGDEVALSQRYPSDSYLRFGQMESNLHNMMTMLDMLKKQNTDLQARIDHLQTCDHTKLKCVYEGRQLDEGYRWSSDSRTSCSCTNGQVQCNRLSECSFHGNIYSNGDVFSPDDCNRCTCKRERVECDVNPCPSQSCEEPSVPKRSCCRDCQTKCKHEGQIYENGDVFVSRSNPCLNCKCSNSQVSCNRIQCPNTPCPNPYRRRGECCPTCSACHVDGRPYNGSFSTVDGCQTCTCQGGNQACVNVQQCPQTCQDGVKPPFGSCCRDCSRCNFKGEVVLNGVSFQPPRDPCRRCVCNEGNIACDTQSCPTSPCRLVETVGGQCCPRCRSCVQDNVWHLHGSQWKRPDDPCTTCACTEGQVQCARENCHVPCKNPAAPPPGSCCPVCDGCIRNGVQYEEGATWTDADQRCSCVRGQVTCIRELRCGDTRAPTPGPCPNPNPNPPARCIRNGVQYEESATWTDADQRCSCVRGQVTCIREPRCGDPRAPTPGPCPNPNPNPPARCIRNGVQYEEGATWTDADQRCSCVRGQVSCIREPRCDDPRAPTPGPCPNPNPPARCIRNGVQYEEGATWTDADQRCSCVRGQVTCIREPRCRDPRAPTPVSCPNPNPNPPARCIRNGVQYEEGATWTDADQRCSCVRGQVTCIREPRCRDPRAPTPVSCPNPNPNPPARCIRNGVQYEEGATWTDADQRCSCVRGQVSCIRKPRCDDPRAPTPGPCPNPNPPARCIRNGVQYEEGATWTDADQRCSCVRGQVSCSRQPLCGDPRAPTPVPCPRRTSSADCEYENRIVTNGDTFPNRNNQCEDCVCTDGRVECGNRECPKPKCNNPRPGTCCQNNCNGCRYAGNEYPNGMEFPHPVDKCRTCRCTNGNVQCLMKRCPAVNCADSFIQPGECCPQCPAPPADCYVEGQRYRHMQQFYHPINRCQLCSCTNGMMRCQHRPCPSATCSHPIIQECCRTCDGCMYGGVEYQNGQEFADPADHCGQCMCRDGHVTCNKRQCHNPGCSYPVIRLDQCCPVCDGCQFEGRVYADGETFQSPKGSCEECRCSRGEVQCSPKSCPEVFCPNPRRDPCTCNVCEGCLYRGRECGNGERFPNPNDPCQGCICLNGSVSCTPVSCPKAPCKWPVRLPGECCPVCTGTCEHLGQVHENGATFTPPNDRCSTCICQSGDVFCEKKLCSQQCTHPAHYRNCCPVCDDCLFEGQKYGNTQTFYVPSDPCKRCVCHSGSVTCTVVACPVVSCQNPVTPPGQCCPQCRVCVQQGQEYEEGQSLTLHPTDRCLNCTCVGGEVSCVGPQCTKLTCMHQVTDLGSCCPRCRGCFYDGVEHLEGSTWFPSSGPCMSCMCVNGVTTCSEVHCLSTCLNQISVPGECCPVCADCVFEGHVYGPGESFHPSDDPCQICTCEVMPDGQQHLRCYRKQCPSLVDCPKHNILYSVSDSCCPVCAQPLSNCTASLIGNEVLATDDPCFTCQCKDLTWTCIHRGCPPLSCPPDDQHTPPDTCCPICDKCVLEDDQTHVPNGQRWTDKENECITCICNQGHIECDLQECPPLDCPDGSVKVKNPGKCCLECKGITAVVHSIDTDAQCVYEGQVYSHNDHWEVDECTSCTCVSRDVHCQTQRCPTLTCASDETPALVPGMCCPHCIPHPATCIVFGDPHYRTFDGKMVNFQGTCTYVLAQDCEGGDFSVHVSNEDRGRKGVSWTKEVTVFIGHVVVQLFQDWIVKVDYQPVSLPFLKEPYVYLERKTNTILLNTNVGLKVLWNGRSHVEVSVPGTYKKHMCGLCGNFNNYPQDDMKLRNGQIAKSEADFGNNWKVGSGNSSVRCSDVKNINPCKEAGYSARKTANARCAVLKSPVFERCHKVVPLEMFFASCVYDLCACGSSMDECLCDVLEAYSSQCREAGIILQWRSPTLCAMGCPLDRGYVFDECGPPCPKTCFNKDVPLGVIEAHCFKPCVPGCQCPAGLVEHNSHCIVPEKCPKIIHGNLGDPQTEESNRKLFVYKV